ncbi:hypothetical protein BH11ACT8_BH11ACT8_11890 [soil metagenome]
MSGADPRQGDYLPSVGRIYVLGDNDEPEERQTPLGVVVVTQCCDLARGGNGDAQVAAVVQLDGSDRSNAASGKSPRYAPLPELGDSHFADFGTTGTVTNQVLVATEREADLRIEPRMLGARAARRVARFAYPDEIQPFLQRLRSQIRAKAGKESSALGQCVARVRTLRIENESGWGTAPPWDVNVIWVLNEGELPTADVVEAPASSSSNSIDQLARAVAATPPGASDLQYLWHALAEALVDDARTKDSPAVVGLAVAEVLEEGEFSFARYLRSTDLDIDDLSETED